MIYIHHMIDYYMVYYPYQLSIVDMFVTIICHGSLNVPIEHHPTIRYMVYHGYYKVMSNITKMGHLPTPVCIYYHHMFAMHQPTDLALEEPEVAGHWAPCCPCAEPTQSPWVLERLPIVTRLPGKSKIDYPLVN